MVSNISRVFLILVITQSVSNNMINDITTVPKEFDINFTQIISKYNYKSEDHTVYTEDGYILKIFRLIQAANCTGKIKGRPVILMHGYLISADAWVVSGPKAGLGYLIADLCLDLWIGNFRGNFYSRHHVTMNPDKDLDFWKYSHTEYGRYDLPAIMDYVLKATNSSNVSYIGFSQGAGCFYVMCSERPQYCEKVNLMLSVAPSTRHLNTKSLTFRLQTEIARIIQSLSEMTW